MCVYFGVTILLEVVIYEEASKEEIMWPMTLKTGNFVCKWN